MLKKIVFFLALAAVVVFLGRTLSPFSQKMFDFHDQTQPARIAEFTFNLDRLEIPPRIAPHFSFNMGYPVFDFYAPFSYWVTSLLNVAGLDVVDSIKVSFLLAILIGYAGMYLFLKLFFNFVASLAGAALFVASPWVAVEIFIRGNLGEVWLIALIPWVLYLLYRNSREESRRVFVATSFILTAAITAHNVLSLIFIPWVVIYILLLKNAKKNLLALFGGFLLAAYFLIPAVLESKFTHAAQLARGTNYHDHFLCLKQIWTTPFWGYGASLPGCQSDGFSFMLGKMQLILASLGSAVLIWYLIRKRIKSNKVMLLIFLLTVSSIFLTLYQSSFIWEMLASIMGLFQFPWRFLALAVFGDAVLGAYFLSKFKAVPIKFLILLFVPFLVIYNAKFFTKFEMPKSKFNHDFLAEDYVSQRVTYAIREYLPVNINYREWVKYEPRNNAPYKQMDPLVLMKSPISPVSYGSTTTLINTEYDKVVKSNATKVLANIHYFPFWEITVDGKKFKPDMFDDLGRPVINLTKPSTIRIHFRQTVTEKAANLITLFTIISLLYLLSSESLWKKMKNWTH